MTEASAKNLKKLAVQVVIAGVLQLSALTASAASFPEPLTEGQLVGEVVFLAALAADRQQTLQLKGFCDGRSGCTVHETNPLLGREPSRSRVNNYFLGAALAHAVVLYSLSSAYRSAWIASGIAVEVAVVGRNKRLGLRVSF